MCPFCFFRLNSFCRTLAEEEPDVTSVAIRPGMVDTDVTFLHIHTLSFILLFYIQMQRLLRTTGATHLQEKDYQLFVRVHAEGKLVDPDDCGHVIASLSLQATKNLSGQFISWDSNECKPYREDKV